MVLVESETLFAFKTPIFSNSCTTLLKGGEEEKTYQFERRGGQRTWSVGNCNKHDAFTGLSLEALVNDRRGIGRRTPVAPYDFYQILA